MTKMLHGPGGFPVHRRDLLRGASALGAAIAVPGFARRAFAQGAEQLTANAKKWIDTEFQPSTLSKDEQLKEMEFFIKAAEPFRGMDINVVSETITTHEYESKTLARAFSEITGINMMHDLILEGDVI